METKYVIVPFEVELAKKITNGECGGRIVTRDGRKARVVCWDANGRDDYILALLSNENREYPVNFMPNGLMVKDEKTQSDLMLEIPEYMTFKDGDVYTTTRGSVGIYNSNYKTLCDSIPFYVGMRNGGELIFRKNDDYAGFGYITGSVLSTESERQKLIDALKQSEDTRAKECLKKLGIESNPECEFKTGQPVIGMDGKRRMEI